MISHDSADGFDVKMRNKNDLKYKRKLGLDFNAKFSFCLGVTFPLPIWYSELSAWQKKLWWAYRRFGDFTTLLLFISNIVKIIQEYHDIRVFTTCIGTITYIICVTVKLAIFWRQVNIINGVLDSLLRISHALDNNPLGDKGFFKMHQTFVQYIKLFGFGKGFAIASGVSTLAFFEIVFGYIKPDKRTLPMAGWFPFDPLGDPNFIISSLFQLVSYLSFLLKDVAIDLVFMTILVSFNSYLIYLRTLLELIVQEKVDEAYDNQHCNSQENLVWWIKQYQSVLGTIEDFKLISNPYLFIKYVSVAIILFFGGVLVTSDVVYDLVQQMIVLAINMSNLLQLYIFSVMGDKITENAEIITDGGFDIEMLTNKRSVKMLYFYTLCRSKKPVLIQFGNINPLSVHSFGQIVKMSFSYFTTIVQVRSQIDED